MSLNILSRSRPTFSHLIPRHRKPISLTSVRHKYKDPTSKQVHHRPKRSGRTGAVFIGPVRTSKDIVRKSQPDLRLLKPDFSAPHILPIKLPDTALGQRLGRKARDFWLSRVPGIDPEKKMFPDAIRKRIKDGKAEFYLSVDLKEQANVFAPNGIRFASGEKLARELCEATGVKGFGEGKAYKKQFERGKKALNGILAFLIVVGLGGYVMYHRRTRSTQEEIVNENTEKPQLAAT